MNQIFKIGDRVKNNVTDEYGTVTDVRKDLAIWVRYDDAPPHVPACEYKPHTLDRFTVIPPIAPLDAGDDGVPPKEHRVVKRDALPHDSAERKTYPIMTAFIDYFPSAVAALAHHSYVSNEKHNPGQPVHWSRDKSGDHLDAAARHLLERDLHGLAWRAMAALQMHLEAQGHPVAPAAR